MKGTRMRKPIPNVKKTIPSVKAELFDCRRYVKVGDTVKYESMMGCNSTDDVSRLNPKPYTGTVVGVYEKFILVKLRKVVEHCNRHDILELNGKKVSGGCVGKVARC